MRRKLFIIIVAELILFALMFGGMCIGRAYGYESVLVEAACVLLTFTLLMILNVVVVREQVSVDVLKVCLWCGRVHINNEWLSLDDFVFRYNMTQADDRLCPGCASKKEAHEDRRHANNDHTVIFNEK